MEGPTRLRRWFRPGRLSFQLFREPWDQSFAGVDSALDVTLVGEMPGNIEAGDICLESFGIVNRDLTVFASLRLNTEILEHSQVGVGTDHNEDHIVLDCAAFAV